MDRSPQIEKTLDLISEAMGGSRSPGKCAACPREFDPKEEFADDLSRKEYEISNLCQQCQNSTFSEDARLTDAGRVVFGLGLRDGGC